MYNSQHRIYFVFWGGFTIPALFFLFLKFPTFIVNPILPFPVIHPLSLPLSPSPCVCACALRRLQAVFSRRLLLLLLHLLQTWRRSAALQLPRRATQSGTEGGGREAASGSSPTRPTHSFDTDTTLSLFSTETQRGAFGDVYASGWARSGEPTCPTEVDLSPVDEGCERL